MEFGRNVILQLHSYLYRYHSARGGKWKTTDNEITEILADASVVMKDLRIKLNQLEFDKLNSSLLSAADGMDNLLNSPEIQSAISKVDPILTDVQTLVTQLNSEVNPIAGEIKSSLASLQTTL